LPGTTVDRLLPGPPARHHASRQLALASSQTTPTPFVSPTATASGHRRCNRIL